MYLLWRTRQKCRVKNRRTFILVFFRSLQTESNGKTDYTRLLLLTTVARHEKRFAKYHYSCLDGCVGRHVQCVGIGLSDARLSSRTNSRSHRNLIITFRYTQAMTKIVNMYILRNFKFKVVFSPYTTLHNNDNANVRVRVCVRLLCVRFDISISFYGFYFFFFLGH